MAAAAAVAVAATAIRPDCPAAKPDDASAQRQGPDRPAASPFSQRPAARSQERFHCTENGTLVFCGRRGTAPAAIVSGLFFDNAEFAGLPMVA